MSQQRAQFEEEFRDGPPQPHMSPHISYPENAFEPPSLSYTTPAVPPMQVHVNVPAQMIQRQVAGNNSMAARVVLAIFSMLFVLILFIVAVVSVASYDPPPNAWLAVLLALIFAGAVVWINALVNRRH